MREIKFRAWHVNGKEMVYFNPEKIITDQYQCSELATLMNGGYGDVLNQFTGLKDKNGVEIYDSDIVKASYDRVMQIVWCESYKNSDGHSMSRAHFARWELKTLVEPHSNIESWGNVPMNDFCFPESTIEIIGNIYENPELLKNKAEL
jgi:hypothetical protein